MAITVTDRGYASATSVSSQASSSFTPAAGSMLVAVVTGGNFGTNSVSGLDAGASWTRIGNHQDWSTVNRDFELWACFAGGSPSAGTITVSFGATIGGANVSFIEFSGVDTSGSVANAFGVTQFSAGYNLQAETVTLSAFASATNMTFAVAAKSGILNFTWTDGTFTTMTGATGGGLSVQCAYLASEDNTVAVTFANSTHDLLYAIEIKASGGGGGGEVAGTPHQDLSTCFGPARAARLNGVIQ